MGPALLVAQDLTVCARLVAKLLTIDLGKLTIGPQLGAIDLVGPDLRTVGHANRLTVAADLLTVNAIDARLVAISDANLLALDALRVAGLTLNLRRPLDTLSLTLNTLLALNPSRAFLALLMFNAFGAILPLRHLHPLGTRRARLTLDSLCALRALGSLRRLTLGALSALRTLAAATAFGLS